MFAVIKTGGKQYRAQVGDVLEVEKLNVEEGKKVTFKEVLLVEDKDKALIGTPFVANATVTAKVIENFKDDKIIVFHKKRRKQYKKTRGHRQQLTRVQIEEILTAPPKKAAPKPEAEEKPKAEAKPKAEPKTETEPKPKAEAKPKAAEPKAKAIEQKPKAATEPKAEAKPKAKPKAESKPKAEAKPKSPAKPKTKAGEVKE
jgi:large subunit ribosomal protein L21